MNSAFEYPRRYEGRRWSIVFGSDRGVERFALRELHRAVSSFFPYVIEVIPMSEETLRDREHVILLGTPQNHALIAEMTRAGEMPPPHPSGGYSIICKDASWKEDARVIALAGATATGVLHGVEDFIQRILSSRIGIQQTDSLSDKRRAFDALPDVQLAEHPAISDRGVWSWGYVIYDYRRFLDNMARLKMNLLTIWNDEPPLNCDEVIEAAHARGVRVFLGYQWGWGLRDVDLAKPEDRKRISEEAVRTYREQYSDLNMDGIYFQTKTEHNQTEAGEASTASVACDLVNVTVRRLFGISPELDIHFGLHASSIMDRYPDLSSLDPRVTIVWEDAGTLPYSYAPALPGEEVDWAEAAELNKCPGLDSVDRTIEYSKELAAFRPGSPFAMVAKGWPYIDWNNEFEHHGPFILGERGPDFIRQRLRERKARWAEISLLWRRNLHHAVKFYREVLNKASAGMIVEGLIEDGLLEENIPPSVRMFAETLWNPNRPIEELRDLADDAQN